VLHQCRREQSVRLLTTDRERNGWKDPRMPLSHPSRRRFLSGRAYRLAVVFPVPSRPLGSMAAPGIVVASKSRGQAGLAQAAIAH
jgi:hypothetical protein